MSTLDIDFDETILGNLICDNVYESRVLKVHIMFCIVYCIDTLLGLYETKEYNIKRFVRNLFREIR